jgi:hypothetical protein
MSWYKVEIPKNIVARPNDSVSYSAINATNKKTTIKSAACYSQHMGSLSKYTFDCFPCNTEKSLLPAEDFFLWMKFCAGYGFAPVATIPYTNGEMNCCIFNGNGENRHRIYAGLCCYRWAECLSPLVYEACRLIERRPDFNFYRLMHCVTGKYVTLMGHSFTNVCAPAMSIYSTKPGGIAPRLDLMWALMPRFYFDRGYDKSSNKEQSNLGTTQASLGQEIIKNGLSLPVAKHEDLFDDKWEELFIFGDDYEAIRKCYNKLQPEIPQPELKPITKPKPIHKAVRKAA